jgi:hypothetical protein
MAKHESVATLPSDYNMKMGPVLFNVNASAEAEWVDNVALTSSNKQSDVIITPQVGVTAQWPVTASNTLRLSTSLGYSKYLIHPQYDQGTLLVSPDSVLSFDLYVGDFKINFHDQFSYQQDPASIGSINNVVAFNRMENIAGVGVIWDLNKILLGVNYDRIDFWSVNLTQVNGSNLNNAGSINFHANQFSANASWNMTSTVVFGVEGQGSIRNYDDYGIEDTGYGFGPFTRIEVTPNFKVSASGGFQSLTTTSGSLTAAQVNAPNSVSPVLGAGTTNSYYVDVTLDHRLNSYYTDRLSVGHELQLDVFSQQTDVTYVTYTSSWKVNRILNMAFTLNFENVDSPSAASAISSGSYDCFNLGVQASFPVTRSVSGAIVYQFCDKFDAPGGQAYTVNRLGATLNYHF